MHAAAVLGSGLDEGALNKFRLPGIEITLLKNLPRDAAFDAALIFGRGTSKNQSGDAIRRWRVGHVARRTRNASRGGQCAVLRWWHAHYTARARRRRKAGRVFRTQL